MVSIWLDGLDRNTLVISGTRVAQWRDKGLLGNDVSQVTTLNQPFDNNPPEVQTNIGNMATAANANLPIGTDDRTVFMSERTLSGRLGVTQNTFFYGVNTSGLGFGIRKFAQGAGSNQGDSSSRNGLIHVGAGVTFGSTLPAIYGINQTTTIIAQNQNVQILFDGLSSFNSAVTYNTTAAPLILFNRIARDQGFQGSINEFIVLNVAADDALRQKVEGYLAWRHGSQLRLPATHQFRLRPPQFSM